MVLGNLSFYYTWKNIKSACNSNKFKMPQPGMMNVVCLMDHILFETFKIIFNTLDKNMKPVQTIFPCRFM